MFTPDFFTKDELEQHRTVGVTEHTEEQHALHVKHGHGGGGNEDKKGRTGGGTFIRKVGEQGQFKHLKIEKSGGNGQGGKGVESKAFFGDRGSYHVEKNTIERQIRKAGDRRNAAAVGSPEHTQAAREFIHLQAVNRGGISPSALQSWADNAVAKGYRSPAEAQAFMGMVHREAETLESQGILKKDGENYVFASGGATKVLHENAGKSQNEMTQAIKVEQSKPTVTQHTTPSPQQPKAPAQAHTKSPEVNNQPAPMQAAQTEKPKFGSVRTETTNGIEQMVIEGNASVIKTNYVKQKDQGGGTSNHAKAAMNYGSNHGSTAATGKAISAHAQEAAKYMDRDQPISHELEQARQMEGQARGEELTNTFGSDGQRLTKEELEQTKQELQDITGFRRIIFSPNPAIKMTAEEVRGATVDLMNSWKEATGKGFSYSFAIHDDQAELHAHILMTCKDAKANDINMGSKQLERFKTQADLAIDRQVDHRLELERIRTKEITPEHEIEAVQEQSKEIDKQLEQPKPQKQPKLKLTQDEIKQLRTLTDQDLKTRDPGPLLDSLGIKYQATGGGTRYAFAMRGEKTPSANLWLTKNGEWAYKDHGGRSGGTAVTVAQQTLGSDYHTAREFTLNQLGVEDKVTAALGDRKSQNTQNIDAQLEAARERLAANQNRAHESSANSKVLKSEPFNPADPQQKEWAQGRGFDPDNMPSWVKKITGQYQTTDKLGKVVSKDRYGIGVEMADGKGADIHFTKPIDLGNGKSMKTQSFGEKGLSIIEPEQVISQKTAIVFESKNDAISAYQAGLTESKTIVIANGTSQAARAAGFIQSNNFDKLEIFQQNDKAGTKFADHIVEQTGVLDHSYIKYEPGEQGHDINDLTKKGVNLNERLEHSDRWTAQEEMHKQTLNESELNEHNLSLEQQKQHLHELHHLQEEHDFQQRMVQAEEKSIIQEIGYLL